jgi:hypothetical protein
VAFRPIAVQKVEVEEKQKAPTGLEKIVELVKPPAGLLPMFIDHGGEYVNVKVSANIQKERSSLYSHRSKASIDRLHHQTQFNSPYKQAMYYH